MSNPFDVEDGRYLALRNEEGQFSLWPEFVSVPPGWKIVSGGDREQCLDHINDQWGDLRCGPNS